MSGKEQEAVLTFSCKIIEIVDMTMNSSNSGIRYNSSLGSIFNLAKVNNNSLHVYFRFSLG